MKNFIVTQVVKQTKTYIRTIEAETEQEALALVDLVDYDSVHEWDEEVISVIAKEELF